MITLEAYWKGRDIEYADQLTDEIYANAERTVERVNRLLALGGRGPVHTVNSGWRPKNVNDATANAATGSKHLTAEAVDIGDPDGALDRWCLDNLGVLVEFELWLEHPGWTDGWCHLQIVPPRSGARVFIPSSKPPMVTIYGKEAIFV